MYLEVGCTREVGTRGFSGNENRFKKSQGQAFMYLGACV